MSLQVKGISYVVGDIGAADMRRDLSAVRDDLHCTTVMLIGADTERQLDAARTALELGLDVYIRPELTDRPRRELLDHLAATAVEAEKLREAYPGRVTLVLGTEYSLTSPGMIPGPKVFIRLQILLRWRRFFDRRITRKLDALLADGAATARQYFRGPVTYAAGHWESVDWSRFDLVGVNLYRIGSDLAGYEQRLRDLIDATDKPVVITEFGCGAHLGAEQRGPGSFRIVKWFAEPPRIKDGHVRDEQTQATYLGELIELYDRHDVHGCFVYTFSMHDFPHADDPGHDLDMAGFGVVKTSADDPARWEPKEAFHEVARRYVLR